MFVIINTARPCGNNRGSVFVAQCKCKLCQTNSVQPFCSFFQTLSAQQLRPELQYVGKEQILGPVSGLPCISLTLQLSPAGVRGSTWARLCAGVNVDKCEVVRQVGSRWWENAAFLLLRERLCVLWTVLESQKWTDVERDGWQWSQSSQYLFSETVGMLCEGQDSAFRKDTDHFTQLIHSMYTVQPHQSIELFIHLSVPKRQECFSFVWNAQQSKKSNLIPGLSSLAETCPCCEHWTPKFRACGYLSRLLHDTTAALTVSPSGTVQVCSFWSKEMGA